jgi:hypothetical protein
MRRATMAGALIGLLALAGCTATEDGAEPAPDEEPSVDGTDDSGDEALDPTDPACLIGDWVLAEDQMQSFYDAISTEVESVSFTVEGDTGLSFTATDYRYTPDFTLVLEIDNVGNGEGVTTGSLGGTYTATGGVITTTLADNDVAVTVTVLGQTIDGSDLFGSFIESDPINAAPFDCSSGAPVLQFETPTGRTPVALTPAG